MVFFKRLVTTIISIVTAGSIIGTTVNANTIESGLEIDGYMGRLQNSIQCPFEKIDTISINLYTEDTSENYKGSVSFFNGIKSLTYEEFGSEDSGELYTADKNGCVKITFDNSMFADIIPYTDIYVTSIEGNIVVDSIDFYGSGGNTYYYSIYPENAYKNSDIPMGISLVRKSIFQNSPIFYELNPDGSLDIDISNPILQYPFFSYLNSNTNSFKYPVFFDFYKAISETKSTYTLFNNNYSKAQPWKTAFTMKTIAGGGELDNKVITDNSFIYAVYAIDKTEEYTSEDAIALTVSNGEYLMKIPSAETISIADYLNAIYGSMTVEKILNSTFTKEQIARMTKKELYQITELISAHIQKTFGSIESVLTELDRMVKTNINSELSVESIYVSAFLPEDIKKIAELKFAPSEITQVSFIAQKSSISLIEAYSSITLDNQRYISSIADGEMIYENYKYIDYASSNKPSTGNTNNNSSNSGQNSENQQATESAKDNTSKPNNENTSSKSDSTTQNASNSDNGKTSNKDNSSSSLDKTTGLNIAAETDKEIDINPSTDSKGISGLIFTLIASAFVIKISQNKRLK